MSAAAVRLQDLTKSFGRHQVLAGITTEVHPGDVVGVIGKNGAGKTTLLETLLGFSPPTSGTAQVFGEEATQMSNAVKARIGFVPQQEELLPTLTGRRQLALNGCFYRNWDHALIERLAREWEVPLDRRVGALSSGERQKLATLMALGNHPDLLVLDEPVAALDPLARRRFLQQLLEIAADPSRAVIFSSHIVSDLERVANRIWILRDGVLLWDGDTDALKQSVKRLHITARRPLPSDIGVPRQLSMRRGAGGTTVTVTVRDLEDSLVPRLEQRLDAHVEIEGLGLEDIFLEIHS
ncbi:MAG: ABC transporter ATP-binding protein [Pseudomonadota bacterium]|jgi:ABC-2 type transport system ATP-binding protein|nr:MAG: ABC transporter ATP-binding protein [Pseudomonadota bacterium]